MKNSMSKEYGPILEGRIVKMLQRASDRVKSEGIAAAIDLLSRIEGCDRINDLEESIVNESFEAYIASMNSERDGNVHLFKERKYQEIDFRLAGQESSINFILKFGDHSKITSTLRREARRFPAVRQRFPEEDAFAFLYTIKSSEAEKTRADHTEAVEQNEGRIEGVLPFSLHEVLAATGLDYVLVCDVDLQSAAIAFKHGRDVNRAYLDFEDALRLVILLDWESKTVQAYRHKGTKAVRDYRREGALEWEAASTAPWPQVFSLDSTQSETAKYRFLVAASEWEPRHGGISAFNVQLVTKLIELGHEVAVALPPGVTESIQSELSKMGVRLFGPKQKLPGIVGVECFLGGVVPVDDNNKHYQPNVIIGHGRILGPFALSIKINQYTSAKYVHFYHMDPGELEYAKYENDGRERLAEASERSELEAELFRYATVVCAVGKGLYDKAEGIIRGIESGVSPTLVNFIPGLREPRQDDDVGKRRGMPSEKRVLLAARLEDFESKGADIAVKAFQPLYDENGHKWNMSLVLRGTPAVGGVREKIDELNANGAPIFEQRFDPNYDSMKAELARTAAFLMPSKVEGFGLSAYEAISQGVPVVISQRSGLAQTLRSENLPVPSDWIVAGFSELKWKDAICRVLEAGDKQFELARVLKNAIERRNYWERSVKSLVESLGQSMLRNV